MAEQQQTFEEWLAKIAEVKPWIPSEGEEPIDTYVTKYDGAFLCFVDNPDDVRFLFEKGITEQLQKGSPDGTAARIGFNPVEKKWYGWSHRAIAGFGIGSTVELGNVAFEPSTKEELSERMLNWEADEGRFNFTSKMDVVDEKTNTTGIRITWNYLGSNQETKTNESFYPYPEKWGRGKWTAKTQKDAKEMAIAYTNGLG